MLIFGTFMSCTNLSAVSVTGDFFASSLGDSFQNIGTIESEGTSSISDTIVWYKYASGQKSLSFNIAEGYKVDSLSITYPSDFAHFGNSDGSTINDIFWTNGEWNNLDSDDSITYSNGELTILNGTYGVRWMIPAYGFGPATQHGAISLTVHSSLVPEPSTYALILGGLVLGFVAYRRNAK